MMNMHSFDRFLRRLLGVKTKVFIETSGRKGGPGERQIALCSSQPGLR